MKSGFAALMRRTGAAGPVAIVMSFWPAIGGLIVLAFLTNLGPWLRTQQSSGLVVYFLLVAGLLGLSFVPTFACAILAGWAFGFAVGWPLTMAAIITGSLVAYAIGRWICRERIIEIILESPRWRAIHRMLLGTSPGQTVLVITLLRLPPSSPFALTNFALAAARAPWIEYTIGTLLGIAPRTAMAAFAAARLEQLQFKNVGETWMTIAGIAATVVACSLLGLMAQRALRQMSGPDSAAPANSPAA